MKETFKFAYQDVKFSKKLLFLLLFLFFISTFFDSNSEYYKDKEKNTNSYVYFVEHGLRYTNTALQMMLPILLADKIGIVQAVYVGIGTVVSVQLLKRIFNNIHIGNTRIGERPKGGDYNVPSGHSAMATSAMMFLIIRYGWRFAFYMVPVSILTMITRLELKAHTMSAVFSGGILGIIIALLLTSKYMGSFKLKNIFKRITKK